MKNAAFDPTATKLIGIAALPVGLMQRRRSVFKWGITGAKMERRSHGFYGKWLP